MDAGLNRADRGMSVRLDGEVSPSRTWSEVKTQRIGCAVSNCDVTLVPLAAQMERERPPPSKDNP